VGRSTPPADGDPSGEARGTLAHATFRWLADHAGRDGFRELQRINENDTRVVA
jgi:hypothetical protein